MAIVQYEGQQLQIKDEIAADNQRLIAILRPDLPDVVNSVFERHTTEDGQALVKIVRKPLTQLNVGRGRPLYPEGLTGGECRPRIN